MLKRQISARKFLIQSFLLAGVYCISIHVISMLSSWREWSGFDSRTSVNFFQVLLFFNRLGSFFCEDHYVHILKLREPLPPPPPQIKDE